MTMAAHSQQLMIGGGHGSNAVLVAWAQKTMLRPRIKRAAAVAFINAIGNTSQVSLSCLPISQAQKWLFTRLLTAATTGLDFIPLP